MLTGLAGGGGSTITGRGNAMQPGRPTARISTSRAICSFLTASARRKSVRFCATTPTRSSKLRSAGSVAGEDRRAAHRLRRPHLQRDVPPSGLASAARRAVAPDVRRGRPTCISSSSTPRLHSRAMSGNGIRDYAHLGARRWHAASPRYEYRRVPGRGDGDQRRADADSEKPQAGCAQGWPRPGDNVLSVMDTRQARR